MGAARTAAQLSCPCNTAELSTGLIHHSLFNRSTGDACFTADPVFFACLVEVLVRWHMLMPSIFRHRRGVVNMCTRGDRRGAHGDAW